MRVTALINVVRSATHRRGMLARLATVLTPLVAVLLATCASAGTYLNFEHWGGQWTDAEKSPATANDDNMCWAASAANVLAWTGWGERAGFNSADAIFQHYQDHWTNEGGLMGFAWQWWFDGLSPSQGWPGWSQANPAGGRLVDHAGAFESFYHRNGMDSEALPAIAGYLREGYGVALVITEPGRSHTLTCWGFDYEGDDYLGIWVTDSDDDKDSLDPPNVLRFLPVAFQAGRWFLQNGDAISSQYINEVQALAPVPLSSTPDVPEPATALLLMLAAPMVLRRRRDGRSRRLFAKPE